MRVCGLKHIIFYFPQEWSKSHPMRVCGLKPTLHSGLFIRSAVTPYAGVWIETTIGCGYEYAMKSHPMRVCGLKLQFLADYLSCSCHTLCGCVD